MGKFNISSLGVGEGLLNQVSQELKESNETVYISLDLIDKNENNVRSKEEIEELAESIRQASLQYNLIVLPKPDGRYKLIAGERRYLALRLLEKEDEKYNLVPCTITSLSRVKLPITDDLKELYLLNVSNVEVRNKTDADKYSEYLDYKKIYEEARKAGFETKGKTRNFIAGDMKVSPAQVGKYDYINKNASDDLLQALNENKINIAQANEIAHAPKDQQKNLLSIEEDNVYSNNNSSAEGNPKKEKIIDTLKYNNYIINENELSVIKEKYSNLAESVKNTVNLDKKDYAKLLGARERIQKEMGKIETLVRKNIKQSSGAINSTQPDKQ